MPKIVSYRRPGDIEPQAKTLLLEPTKVVGRHRVWKVILGQFRPFLLHFRAVVDEIGKFQLCILLIFGVFLF